MIFQKHELYANVYMRDVVLYIQDCIKNYDGTTTLYGVWWNKGQMGKPWSMGVTTILTLDEHQLRDWSRYDR
jgi:hypothetical protein